MIHIFNHWLQQSSVCLLEGLIFYLLDQLIFDLINFFNQSIKQLINQYQSDGFPRAPSVSSLLPTSTLLKAPHWLHWRGCQGIGKNLNNILITVWSNFRFIFMRDYQLRLFCMVLRFGTCVDRPAWALSKPGSLPYPLIFIPLHLCLQVQPVSKILKKSCGFIFMSIVFSAWTAGQQISVHSLGEGPRGAGLENRSGSNVTSRES